jgi:hypothetical protein
VRWLSFLAVPAAVAAAAVAIAGPSAPRHVARAGPVTAGFYGLNAQIALGAGAERAWPRTAAQLAAVGVGVVRRDAFWSAIEPSSPVGGRHSYRWRATDRLVAALAAHGLRWYPIVDYGVPWASNGDWKAPPTAAHVRDYGLFAGALARRYGDGGRFWRRHPRLRARPVRELEIWNEPNVVRFWADQAGAPARLAAMYLSARKQVAAADPSAHVVLGGLSAVGVDRFLEQMVVARPQLVDRLQAVALHPYGGGPDAGLEVTYARIRLLRTTLDRLVPGRSVPIEITETGWAVPPVPESWRARRLQRLALELPRSDCHVTRFIVHTWTSLDEGSSPEAWFGIAHADGSLRPSGEALLGAIARAVRTTAGKPILRICG